MLSMLLHKHLDEMDVMEAEVKAEVDKIIAGIDMQKLIADSNAVMMDVVDQVRSLMEEKYMPMASKNGFDLAKAISNKDIVVDPSKDPTKNQSAGQ